MSSVPDATPLMNRYICGKQVVQGYISDAVMTSDPKECGYFFRDYSQEVGDSLCSHLLIYP